MKPALTVACLWLLFGGTHLGLATRRVRAVLVGWLGEIGFGALFSLVASITFAALVHVYAGHRFEGTAGLALGEVGGLRWLLRGGVVVGIALAAGAHTLLATRLVGTTFFAGLTLLALAGAWHQDRKLLALRGRPYAAYLAATSMLPFGAALSGRGHVAWRELPIVALGVGVGVALGLRTVHGAIFDHGGAWVIAVAVGGGPLLGLQAWLHARRVFAAAADGRGAAGPEEQASRRRALACLGAGLVAYVGVAHEVVGTTLFPYAPAVFGGPIPFHAVGVAGIVTGLLMVAGTLGLVRVPLVPLGVVLGALGAAIFVLTAGRYGDFHLFALTLSLAGLLVAVASRERRTLPARPGVA
jgi:uncharacterized membrane protein